MRVQESHTLAVVSGPTLLYPSHLPLLNYWISTLLCLELRQLAGKFAPLKPPEGDESGCNGNNETRPDEELKVRFDAIDEDTGEDKEKDRAGAHVSFESRTVEVDLIARAEALPSLSHNLHLSRYKHSPRHMATILARACLLR